MSAEFWVLMTAVVTLIGGMVNSQLNHKAARLERLDAAEKMRLQLIAQSTLSQYNARAYAESLQADLRANTVETLNGAAQAKAAYVEANHVNNKIESLGARFNTLLDVSNQQSEKTDKLVAVALDEAKDTGDDTNTRVRHVEKKVDPGT